MASVWSGRRPRWEHPPPGLPPTHPQNAHGHSNGPVFRRPSLAGFGSPLTIHSARNCSRRGPVSTRTLPTRNLEPRPGNRSGYAGGQEWWGMALTRSPEFSWNGRPVRPDGTWLGSHQGLRPWLGERLALWAGRRTIRAQKPRPARIPDCQVTAATLQPLISAGHGQRYPTSSRLGLHAERGLWS